MPLTPIILTEFHQMCIEIQILQCRTILFFACILLARTTESPYQRILIVFSFIYVTLLIFNACRQTVL